MDGDNNDLDLMAAASFVFLQEGMRSPTSRTLLFRFCNENKRKPRGGHREHLEGKTSVCLISNHHSLLHSISGIDAAPTTT